MSAPPDLPVAEVESAELGRLATELGVADEMPGPSLAGWISDTSETFGAWLASLLVERLGIVSGLAGSLVQYSLALLLLILLAFGAIYLWRWWQRHRVPGEQPAIEGARVEPVAERPDSADSWAERLHGRLGAGDAAAAAEALWWWLATTLGAEAEPSWTSRELIVRAGRRDLAPPVRRLDWMLYGPWSPDVAEVETLWRELGERMLPAMPTEEVS